MKRLVSDWNNIKRDGTLDVLIPSNDPNYHDLPEVDEFVWVVDSGERTVAVVISVTPEMRGYEVTVKPNWKTQEDDLYEY